MRLTHVAVLVLLLSAYVSAGGLDITRISPGNNETWKYNNSVNFVFQIDNNQPLDSCTLAVKVNGTNATHLEPQHTGLTIPGNFDNIWSFSNGSHVFGIVGAENDASSGQIFIVDQATGIATNYTSKPDGRLRDREMCAYVNGTLIVCGGGVSNKDIYHFNPKANTTTNVSTTLPFVLWSGVAASNGTDVWFMGGLNASGNIETGIYRYVLNNATVMDTGNRWPGLQSRYSAVCDTPDAFYTAGGKDSSKAIIRFNKNNETAINMANFTASDGLGRYGMVGFCDHRYFFFGEGKNATGAASNWNHDWWRYDMITEEVINITLTDTTLSYMGTAGSYWNNDTREAIIMGGTAWNYATNNNITRFKPHYLIGSTNTSYVDSGTEYTISQQLENDTYEWFLNCTETSGSTITTSNYNLTVRGNTPPSAPTVTYGSDELTLTCTATGSTDGNGDTLTYYYTFTDQRDTRTLQDYSIDNTFECQDAANCFSGDIIYCKSKAYDGVEYSPESTSINKEISDLGKLITHKPTYAAENPETINPSDTLILPDTESPIIPILITLGLLALVIFLIKR